MKAIFRAVPGQLESSFNAVLMQFQSSFRAVSEQISEQFQGLFRSDFRAISVEFQSSFRVVREQYQGHSRSISVQLMGNEAEFRLAVVRSRRRTTDSITGRYGVRPLVDDAAGRSLVLYRLLQRKIRQSGLNQDRNQSISNGKATDWIFQLTATMMD